MPNLTPEQAADIRQRDNALRAWLKANKRNSYKTEELPASLRPTPTNEERSALGVFEFCRDKPDRYFLYVKLAPDSTVRGIVTTWTGEKLGDCQLGHPYRDNFGGKRQSITVQAINGCTYHGTYYKSAGDYARVKKAKA